MWDEVKIRESAMRRKNNYDLLRVVCAVSIIAIHVNSAWFSEVNMIGGGRQMFMKFRQCL